MAAKVLREDQERALAKLREAVGAGKRRIVMQASVGFGKTVLAAALVESARAKKKRVLFTVPAISLVDQTVEMFYEQGIREIGVIQANHEMTDWSQPVQVASVQTLQRRGLPRADVVLVDEIHKFFTFYEKWFLNPEWAKVPIIGLSATPWTKGLGQYFDELIVAATTEDLIAAGNLSPFRVFAPAHPDLKGVRTVGGDYHEGELGERMNKAELVADVVKTWLEKGRGRPTLCFAVDRAHAKHLQQQFEVAGVSCGYQDAYTKDGDRRELRRKFHSGEYEVVCNVGTLTTGVDWDVRCIVMARPTKSEMLFVQIVGRGLRTAPGKNECLILDHSDNHLRLGFVTDVDSAHAGLHSGKSDVRERDKDKVRLPKECPQCAYLKPPKTAKCPNCGFVAQAHAKVDVEDGELKELERKKKKQPVTGDKEEIYGALIYLARSKGYKPGWADHKYKMIFGVWPRGMKYAKPRPPSQQLLDWLRRQNTHYAIKHRAEEQKQQAQMTETVREQLHAEQNAGVKFVPGTYLTEQDMRDIEANGL